VSRGNKLVKRRALGNDAGDDLPFILRQLAHMPQRQGPVPRFLKGTVTVAPPIANLAWQHLARLLITPLGVFLLNSKLVCCTIVTANIEKQC
jgi:hypothetical protein